MSNQKNIQDELKNLESGLPFINNPVFSVPNGYFEGLASSVLAKVKASEASAAQVELAELSPLLAGIPRAMPYSVPLFYFEENASFIPEFSQNPQLSLLDSIGKNVPYKIPEGYFDTLPEVIKSKVAEPLTKVVPLFARKWVRMAVAAVVGGALFAGGYQYFSETPLVSLAKNSVDTTQNLVAGNAPAIEQEIKKTSTKELDEFIRNVGINVKTQKAIKASAEKDSVKALLEDVSDTEMESFLSVLPPSDDNAVTTTD